MNDLVITRMVFNKKDFIIYVVLDENRNICDFQLFQANDSLINNIYVARVNRILPGINSAFVNISTNQNCFLSLDDVKSPIYTRKPSKKKELCVGDELLVQVTKDALKTKVPVVSTKLSIHEKNIVLTTGNKTIGISKKISTEKASEIREYVKNNYTDLEFGLIFRTSSSKCSLEELSTEIESLNEKYRKLVDYSSNRTLYSKIYQEKPDYLLRIKSYDFSNIKSITTDDEEIYNQLKGEYINTDLENIIHLYYNNSISLKTLYSLTSKIDELTSKKVWLKSGANIIIEQLETLTFIDVNTSKNISKNKESILNVNIEAAYEIARQLKLRNISGMIIVDFINMNDETWLNTMTESLKKALKDDIVPCRFLDFTKLGLVEITRKKVYKSVKEILEKSID